jgi:hypothetical protein
MTQSIEHKLYHKAQEWIQGHSEPPQATSIVAKTMSRDPQEVVPVAIICSFGEEIKRIYE